MNAVFRRIRREPLVHFGLLATVVFFVDAWPRRNDVGPNVIEVSATFVRWLAESRARTGRAPSPAELDALIAEHIDEEILVREAHRLQLADGDPIVRRRIAQKIRFLFEDQASALPTDDALQRHLDAHPQRYQVRPALHITQAFLGPDVPSPSALAQAKRALKQNPRAAVGPPLPIGRDLGMTSINVIAHLFSQETAAQIASAAHQTWIGPVKSRFGYHLVRIEGRREARLPTLAEVRDRVHADFLEADRQAAFEAEMDRLRSAYSIRVERRPTARSLAQARVSR